MKPLELGSDGYRVREWQLFLMKQQYLQQGLPMGHFGPLTQQATMNFQKRNGLKDDGKVGPNTINQARRMGFNPTTAHAEAISPNGTSSRHRNEEIQPVSPGNNVFYTVRNSTVHFTPYLEQKVRLLAEKYFLQTKKKLCINDGSRTAYDQAHAMYIKLEIGDDLSVYKNKQACQEIKDAYSSANKAGKSEKEIIQAMTEVVQKQINRNIYISKHLLANACDIKKDGIVASTLKQAAQETKGKLIYEGTPQHFHVEW